MNSSTWKRIERDWAERLGGVRAPVNGRGEAPDVNHPVYALEIKYGKKLLSARLRLGWSQAKAAAVQTGKLPVLCVTQTVEGQRNNEHFVIVDLETWQAITGDEPNAEDDSV